MVMVCTMKLRLRTPWAEDTMASLRLKHLLMASVLVPHGGQQGRSCFSKGPKEVPEEDDDFMKKLGRSTVMIFPEGQWWTPRNARSLCLSCPLCCCHISQQVYRGTYASFTGSHLIPLSRKPHWFLYHGLLQAHDHLNTSLPRWHVLNQTNEWSTDTSRSLFFASQSKTPTLLALLTRGCIILWFLNWFWAGPYPLWVPYPLIWTVSLLLSYLSSRLIDTPAPQTVNGLRIKLKLFQ